MTNNCNFNKKRDELQLKAIKLKSKIVSNICCIDSENNCQNEETVNELSIKVEDLKSADSIKETPFWRSVNNSVAIIVICFASFIWGFYA